MEKIKSYTDIEQSKKLAEILPLESADMCWFEGEPFVEAVTGYEEERAESHRQAGMEMYPCWSLAALLKLLPQKIEHEGNEAELHINSRMTDLWYENDNFIYFGTFAEKLIDACVQLICTLNEKGLL